LQKGHGKQVPYMTQNETDEMVTKSHRSGFYFGDSIQAQAKRDISVCTWYMIFARKGGLA